MTQIAVMFLIDHCASKTMSMARNRKRIAAFSGGIPAFVIAKINRDKAALCLCQFDQVRMGIWDLSNAPA